MNDQIRIQPCHNGWAVYTDAGFWVCETQEKLLEIIKQLTEKKAE